jgi:hypothetical protein
MFKKPLAPLGAVTLAAIIGVGTLYAQSTGTTGVKVTGEKSSTEVSSTARLPSPLSDEQISAWLAARYDLRGRVSDFAATHASSDDVRQFAQSAHQGYVKTLARLFASDMATPAKTEFDVAGVLEQIATRIRQQRAEADSKGQREVRGFRGIKGKDAKDAGPATSEADKDAKGQIRGPHRLEASEDRREAFIEKALPMLKENLPQILDTVTEAVRRVQSSASESAVIALEREAARQTADRVCNELAKKKGSEFDRAYLSFEVGTGLCLVESLKAAAPHGSEKLQPVIDASLSLAEADLARACDLLGKIDSAKVKD